MAKLYIKKFRLIAGGKSYEAGSVVELPDAEAYKLANNAPEEFEVLAASVSTKQEETVTEQKEEVKAETVVDNPNLYTLKLAELRELCKEKGINYKAKDTKEKLILAIQSSEEEDVQEELLDGLPPIDMSGVVK